MATITRITAATALLTVLLALGAATAAAHSDLSSSDPADGSIVTEPVEQVTFVFTRPVEPFTDGFTLRTGNGVTLDIASVSQVDDHTVVVAPVEPITEAVLAGWAIISGDSHPVTGTVVFAVDAVVVESTATGEQTAVTQPAVTRPTSAPTTVPTASASTHPPVSDGSARPPVSDGSARSPVEDESARPPVAASVRGPAPRPEDERESPTVATGGSAVGATASADDALEQLRFARDSGRRSHATPELFDGILRWVGYAATVAALGGLMMTLVSDRAEPVVWPHARGVVRTSLVVLGLGSLLSIGAHLAVLTGDPGDLLTLAQWPEVFHGRFASGILVRLAGVALLATVALRNPRTAPRAVCVGAALVIASFVLLGHSSGRGSAWLTVPGAVVHLAAVSVWTGGLLAVLLVVRRGPAPSVRTVTSAFSRMAAAALAGTVVAGIALTADRVASVDELWTTTFGQRLAVKLVLVAGVVGLGAIHRFRTVPRLRASAGTEIGQFIRVAWVEVAGFAVVLALTAWLVAGAT